MSSLLKILPFYLYLSLIKRVFGLMVAEVEFEFRDRSPNPIMRQMTAR